MNKPYPFSEINSALAGSKNVGILLPEDPDYDIVAASLALFLSLKKAGKEVTIASPTPMRVEFSHLVGLDKITQRIVEDNSFVISVDYPVDNVAKVVFDDSKGKVDLIIKLKKDVPQISADKICFPAERGTPELYFLIGGKDYRTFDKLVPLEQIQEKNTILINRGQVSFPFGKIKIVDPTASSYSEIITAVLITLSLPGDQDIAQNLFLGLSKATADFSSETALADTFEAAALCLRAGAKREFFQPTPHLQPSLKEETKAKSPLPSPDWLTPKIYRGTSLV